jgi:hypothetical protein
MEGKTMMAIVSPTMHKKKPAGSAEKPQAATPAPAAAKDAPQAATAPPAQKQEG